MCTGRSSRGWPWIPIFVSRRSWQSRSSVRAAAERRRTARRAGCQRRVRACRRRPALHLSGVAGFLAPTCGARMPLGACRRVALEFDTGSGWTVPTQLAFVPLLFACPPRWRRSPSSWRSSWLSCRTSSAASCSLCGCCASRATPGLRWAPPLSLAPREHRDPADTAMIVLMDALAAQLIGDFATSATMELLVRGASLREQLRETWVYAVDVAPDADRARRRLARRRRPGPSWRPVPLLALLAVFGREREARMGGPRRAQQRLPRHRAGAR